MGSPTQRVCDIDLSIECRNLFTNDYLYLGCCNLHFISFWAKGFRRCRSQRCFQHCSSCHLSSSLRWCCIWYRLFHLHLSSEQTHLSFFQGWSCCRRWSLNIYITTIKLYDEFLFFYNQNNKDLYFENSFTSIFFFTITHQDGNIQWNNSFKLYLQWNLIYFAWY